jgi:hypothetical protein
MAKRLGGLCSFLLAAIWALRWEALRAYIYERGFQVLESAGIDPALHWGIPVALVAAGLFLFWRTGQHHHSQIEAIRAWLGPRKKQKENLHIPHILPEGLPDLRIADNPRVAALFESGEQDKLFPLLEADRLHLWARPMRSREAGKENALGKLPGSIWKDHFLAYLPQVEGQFRAQTFIKMQRGQQSVWFDAYFNQKQIEAIWPELEWIPLLTAARLAYEAIEEGKLEKLFTSSKGTIEDKISSVIGTFMAHNGKMDLRGKKPPSSVVRSIPRDEYINLRHIPNTNSLGPLFANDSGRRDDVVVLRADLASYIDWIRDLANRDY